MVRKCVQHSLGGLDKELCILAPFFVQIEVFIDFG
jgi:hypothetical protein